MSRNHLTLIVTLSVFGLTCWPGWVQAADLVVNRLDDRDGICNFMNMGCSLREAIEMSNATAEYDTIYLPAGRIELSQVGVGEDENHFGDLDITKSVTIVGRAPGVSIVDGNSLDRVFHVNGVSVLFKMLTVTGGKDFDSYDGGGAIKVDSGVAIVVACDLTGNVSWSYGGGVFVENGTLWLQDTTVRDNWAAYAGGGIWVSGDSSPVLQIDRSTISGNEAGGGAAFFASNATVQIRESTISDNTHSDPYFEAIEFTNGSQGSMEYCTVSGNSDPSLASIASNLSLHRTIIQGQCYTSSGGTITSAYGNLESPGNTCNLDADGDLRNVANPMLSPLGLWGGTTETHRPLAGSPAVDHVFPISLPSCSDRTDQRGMDRPQDGSNGIGTPCDIGAVELVYGEIFIDGFECGYTGAWQ